MNSSQVAKHVLDNGVTVIVDSDSRFRSAAYAVTLVGGLRDETVPELGITHLLEHLLFKRTTKKNTKEIAKAIDDLGGGVNALTDVDSLSIHGRVPKGKLKDLMSFFDELLLEAAFSEDDLLVEREIVRQEILDADDDPDDVVYRTYSEGLWPSSIIGKAVFGSIETLETLTLDQLRGRLAEIREGARLIIAASGAVDENEVLAHAKRAYSSLKPGRRPNFEKPSTGRGFIPLSRPLTQIHFCLGAPWPDVCHPQYLAGEVISDAVGESMSSRLFQLVREEKGLSYDIASEVDTYPNAASFAITAALEQKNLDQALELVWEELKKLRIHGLEDEEINRSVQAMCAQLDMEHDSVGDRLWRAVETEISHGRYISVEEEISVLKSLTKRDLEDVMKEFLSPDRLILVLAGEIEGYNLPSSIADVLSD